MHGTSLWSLIPHSYVLISVTVHVVRSSFCSACPLLLPQPRCIVQTVFGYGPAPARSRSFHFAHSLHYAQMQRIPPIPGEDLTEFVLEDVNCSARLHCTLAPT